jgi:hypothetical protein
MTEEDYRNRQGRSEAQYESAMICLGISYIGLIITFILIIIS